MSTQSKLLMVAALLLAPCFRAAEITAVGISLPFFDDSGRPTHKITAQRGTLSGPMRTLTGVELVYFSATEPGRIIQRLQTSEATWDVRQEKLEGKGRLVVTTDEHRLSGEGFDFALPSSRLDIHRAFSLENSEIRLTSDRAIVDFQPGKGPVGTRPREVRRCEASGNLTVIVLPTARKKYPCEQAFSETAIYDGIAQTVVLPKPTRILAQGRESNVGQIAFDLSGALKK
jgi:hypothetical protein